VLDTDYYAKKLDHGGFENDVQIYIYSGVQIPVYPVVPDTGTPILGYSAGDVTCIDCTLRGTNKQPDFWINP